MTFTDINILRVVNKKDLVIHPFNKDRITGVGYDLSIGIIRPLNEFENFYEDAKVIRIPPKCYCLIITEEFVWFSKRLIGTLHSRGTLAAKGLFTNSTNVDPNFKGQMIMSVYNVSDANIIISKDFPTFITLIIHVAKTPTEKLVGEEGTKNSTRVLLQMLNDIYTDEISHARQRKAITDLHTYMLQKNHEVSPPFEIEIARAKAFINPFKKWKFSSFINAIGDLFTSSISNIFKVILLGVAVYFLFGLIKELIINRTLSKEDSRLLILLLVAIVGLTPTFLKKKGNEK